MEMWLLTLCTPDYFRLPARINSCNGDSVMRNDDSGFDYADRFPVRAIHYVLHKEKRAGYRTRWHREREAHELIYVDYGAIRLRAGDLRVELDTGDCFVVSRGTFHEFHGKSGRAFDFLNVVYSGRAPGGIENRVLHLPAEERALVRALKEESLALQPGHEAMMILKLNELLLRLGRRDGSTLEQYGRPGDTTHRYHGRVVRHALGYLEHHFSQPLDAKAVARHAGVSRSHLRALLRRETGRSLRSHLRGFRVERAKRLLRESSENIATVSYRVGYQSVPHFCTVFKRAVGKTPSEYVRSLK